jgi:CHRD domain/Secretion system C-terminal sorting domain
LKAGKFYLLIKTAASPNGALTSSLVANKTDAAAQQTDRIRNEITGAQQVPANTSTGNGILDGVYERDKRLFSFRIDFNKLAGNVTAAHFHLGANGANGPVALDLVSLGFPTGVKDGTFIKAIVLTEEQGAALIAGKYYLNIHTDLFPNGELRSQLNYRAAAPVPVTSPTGKASGTFSGAQQNPAVNTAATGKMEGIFDTYSRGFAFRIDFSGLSSPVTAAHFHGGAAGTNGAVTLDLVPLGFPTGVTNGSFVKFLHLTAAQAEDLKSGKMYVNIHTANNPGGEIRAQVAYLTADIAPAPAPNKVNKIAGGFTGAQEVPAVATKATGTIDGIFDPYSRVLAFRIDFAGLNSTVTKAHFHSGAAGTNGPAVIDLVAEGFPTGVTSGSFVKVITLTVAQAADLVAGKLYANIHTISSPNGEIRAQINYNPASVAGRKGNTEGVTIAEKLNISEKVALYPNPAREGVTINTSDFAGEAVRIVLYNAAGQTVKVEAINAMNASHRLELNGLNKGLYILQMTSETSKATQKLIVE